MSLSQSCASNVVPLLLRLGLGVVFLWAGWGKLNGTMEVSGADAALLANVNLIQPPLVDSPAAEPIPDAGELDNQTDPADEAAEDAAPAEPPANPADTTASLLQSDAPLIIRVQDSEAAEQVDQTQPPATTGSTPGFSASDFPDPVSTTRAYSIALVMMRAAEPTDGGTPLWPAGLARPWMVKWMSLGVTLFEFIAGILMVVGVFTRLAALGLVATMGVAMMLTTVGPAIASGNSFLGFLPPMQLDTAGWVEAWTPWLVQLLVLLMAASLVLTGAGAMSFDRAFFGRRAERKAKKAESKGDED
jgi:uncharacterized membrane protein YphA (DoxX/SURF4 family)